MRNYIADPVVKRLPAYYRHLRALEKMGILQISSQDLGAVMDLTPSQIRQDLNRIGAEGRQGYGYAVPDLREHIAHLMGVDRPHRMIILGAGNIGHAVSLSSSFPLEGFETVAIFDTDAGKVGKTLAGLPIRDISELDAFVKSETVDIAVIALPADVAQDMTDRLLALGVKAFWNFAPVDLHLPADAVSLNVHLTDGLEVLSYQLTHLND